MQGASYSGKGDRGFLSGENQALSGFQARPTNGNLWLGPVAPALAIIKPVVTGTSADRLVYVEWIGSSAISSVTTVNPVSAHWPKLVLSATSVASRPRAIRTRPMRGVLCRASKVYQR